MSLGGAVPTDPPIARLRKLFNVPGPVRVTIHVASAVKPGRGIAYVIDEIDADQLSRGFHRRAAAELQAADESRQAEEERDREQDQAG
jgi:hypothetical protein